MPAKRAAATSKTPPPKTARKTTSRKGADRKTVDPRPAATAPAWAQSGDVLTTAQGARVDDTDNTLRAGPRGPALLEDFHLREKITHFDHERIPERAVHARGAGAHGRFVVTNPIADLTRARFLSEPGLEVPVFVRFSTVAGSRGSADTVRDVRGFATKFYTPEGNVDLVGNNIPVFFIQDGIKFPDLVHAAKPEPDREIPQAATAHDTFWDFVGLQPEATHMLMWAMSDRGIPRSYRTMEGFGVHTFRLVNAAGETHLVKFHWKPVAGVHSLVWEESQKLCGIDADFHRRDLWDSIEAGAFPEYDLGVQVLPDDGSEMFEGIDLLDPTKIVPEELAPVRLVGRLTLDRNPTNFFAETEQIAFHPGHLVPGLEVTNDPLIQARLFSYLDTQLTRLGGPNFSQIPINRPHAPVNDNLRDGFMQQAIPEGVAPYAPNSMGGGCPYAMNAVDPTSGDAYRFSPQPIEGERVRQRPVSFDDHYSQATLFWTSMTSVEQDHIVGAFSFELSKVETPEVVTRMLGNLANVDAVLVERVAANLGLPAPAGQPARDVAPSLALSMVVDTPGPIAGRVVAVLVADGVDTSGLALVQERLEAAGATVHLVAPHAGTIKAARGADGVEATKTLYSCESVEFDAVLVAGGPGAATIATTPKAILFLQEAYRHHKPVGAWGTGVSVLDAAGATSDEDAAVDGVITATKTSATFAKSVIASIGLHRFWDRPTLG